MPVYIHERDQPTPYIKSLIINTHISNASMSNPGATVRIPSLRLRRSYQAFDPELSLGPAGSACF